ncbi:FAD-dependent oxidoreductase [Virgisporangium aliadipatigenens]|uniref:FAD-dependent oxidoreductase n=1 Tax=Virgisporangium aliadipatigenens TaxID=741659 RepID=A0A8J3YJ10_9ACTN|nr:FAD-dependent monooxygenase [Virgisporangium aliadipatigenens]GIJ45187.1 FAD-dependent oxidoreductase [Virgisporangium aliadipatigenens]
MRVIVCGAGIAGLALAQRLAAQGAEVTVLERASGPRAGGYMIDFFGPGYDAAEAMGVLPRILELGYRVDELAYCDESGRRRAGLRYAQFARAAGGRVVSVLRPDLERALREHLGGHVDLRYGRTIAAVDDRVDGVTVTLDDGDELTAGLLVGCDGIHSAVRALVFGPEREYLRHLGFHTAAYSFADPAARAEIGGRMCMTDSLDRAMGFYGLRDGRVAVFSVHHSADPALPDDPRAALRREFGRQGWLVPRALAACPPSEGLYYDQVAQVVMPSWSRGRVALLGDAAYAVSLLAGQGAALAVAGAYLLGEHLARAASVEAALAGYERALRPVVLDRQETARKGVRWFAPTTRGRLRLRRAALAAARLPLADRLFANALVGKPSAVITGHRIRVG